MPTPYLAIVGRANVGKSTLFNKITGTRSAIINNTPGVTRDRNYGHAEWAGKSFMVIDTGGIDLEGRDEIEPQVRDQADLAIAEADAILFVVDCRQGLTPQDRDVIEQVRVSGKPLFLAVNKVDDPKQDALVTDFYQLGIEHTFSISAEHGLGIMELMEAVVRNFPEEDKEVVMPEGIRLAIVGRPNAGKSSLVNRLLKLERCIVSKIPGTTRDAVDIPLTYNGRHYVLIDTAGIRRKGKTVRLLDKFSTIMALKALDRCDIAILVLDAEAGVTDQDATIAGYAFDRGRACIILLNKWDLIEKGPKIQQEFEARVRNKLKFLDFAPIMTASAKTGQGLRRFFTEVDRVYDYYSKNIPTAKLNECINRAIQKNPMTSHRGKFLKLFYATQVKSRPPTFQCFVNYPRGVHFSYRRYLVNSLRKAFGFVGTPVRLLFTGRRPEGREHGLAQKN